MKFANWPKCYRYLVVALGQFLAILNSSVFPYTGIIFTSDTFGQGTGLVVMDYVHCSGSELSLWDCSHFTHKHGCTHNDDLGIRCQPGNFAEYLIRSLMSTDIF